MSADAGDVLTRGVVPGESYEAGATQTAGALGAGVTVGAACYFGSVTAATFLSGGTLALAAVGGTAAAYSTRLVYSWMSRDLRESALSTVAVVPAVVIAPVVIAGAHVLAQKGLNGATEREREQQHGGQPSVTYEKSTLEDGKFTRERVYSQPSSQPNPPPLYRPTDCLLVGGFGLGATCAADKVGLLGQPLLGAETKVQDAEAGVTKGGDAKASTALDKVAHTAEELNSCAAKLKPAADAGTDFVNKLIWLVEILGASVLGALYFILLCCVSCGARWFILGLTGLAIILAMFKSWAGSTAGFGTTSPTGPGTTSPPPPPRPTSNAPWRTALFLVVTALVTFLLEREFFAEQA